MPAVRIRLAIALAVPALALSACAPSSSSEDTADDFKGEQQKVAQLVEDLEEAGSKRDGNEVCQQLLSEDLRTTVQKASQEACPSAVDEVLDEVQTTDLQVQKVEIKGSTATARVLQKVGDDERTDTMTFTRERGGWRISGLG